MENQVKFVTPVAMKVTQDQYEKDLKGSLKKLGYSGQVYITSIYYYLVTNYGNRNADNVYHDSIGSWDELNDRVLIEDYNPELFLAVAAMTEFVLPERWCVKSGEQSLVDYCNDNGVNKGDYVSSQCSKYYCHFPEVHKCTIISYIKKDYTEITFEQFEKYVLKNKINKMKKEQLTTEEPTRFPFRLTSENAKEIINIACSTWKHKLATEWGASIILNHFIMITETRYKEMRKACDESQNVLFDAIFGNDILTIKLGNKVKVVSGGPGAYCADGITGYVVPNVESSSEGYWRGDVSYSAKLVVFNVTDQTFYRLADGYKLELLN